MYQVLGVTLTPSGSTSSFCQFWALYVTCAVRASTPYSEENVNVIYSMFMEHGARIELV